MKRTLPALVLAVLTALAMLGAMPAPGGEPSAPKPPTPAENVERGRALLGKGMAAEGKELLEKTAAELQAALAKNPDDAASVLLLGRIWFYLDKDNEAMECFERSIRIDPKTAEYHFWKGVLLRLRKSYDEAVRELSAACQLEPATFKYHVELGRVYSEKEDHEKALACFKKAVELNPKNAGAAFEVGVAFAQQEKLDDALKMFQIAAELNPNDTAPAYNIGQIYQKKEMAPQAIVQFQTVVKLDPGDWRAWSKLVQLYQATGDTAARDAARAALFDLRARAKVKSLAEAPHYCRDQFVTGGRKVMVFEYFELRGNEVVKYAFNVLDKAGRENERRIVFGYHEELDASARGRGELQDGRHGWHLDGWAGDRHETYMFFSRELSYDEVRKAVEKVVAGNVPLISSSGPNEDVKIYDNPQDAETPKPGKAPPQANSPPQPPAKPKAQK
jgi:tetratricopeptide (TPR) repeat protein